MAEADVSVLNVETFTGREQQIQRAALINSNHSQATRAIKSATLAPDGSPRALERII